MKNELPYSALKKSPKSQAILAEHLAQQPLCDLYVNLCDLVQLI